MWVPAPANTREDHLPSLVGSVSAPACFGGTLDVISPLESTRLPPYCWGVGGGGHVLLLAQDDLTRLSLCLLSLLLQVAASFSFRGSRLGSVKAATSTLRSSRVWQRSVIFPPRSSSSTGSPLRLPPISLRQFLGLVDRRWSPQSSPSSRRDTEPSRVVWCLCSRSVSRGSRVLCRLRGLFLFLNLGAWVALEWLEPLLCGVGGWLGAC